MPQQPLLRRPRVVGRDDEQPVGARPLGRLGQAHAVRRVVGARTGHHGGAIADRGHDRPHELGLLVVGRGGALAGGAVEDQAVVAQLDQVRRQLLGALQVERALGVERRDHGGEHAPERAAGVGPHTENGTARPRPDRPAARPKPYPERRQLDRRPLTS